MIYQSLRFPDKSESKLSTSTDESDVDSNTTDRSPTSSIDLKVI